MTTASGIERLLEVGANIGSVGICGLPCSLTFEMSGTMAHMAQTEMRAMRDMPLRVHSMEGLRLDAHFFGRHCSNSRTIAAEICQRDVVMRRDLCRREDAVVQRGVPVRHQEDRILECQGAAYRRIDAELTLQPAYDKPFDSA